MVLLSLFGRIRFIERVRTIFLFVLATVNYEFGLIAEVRSERETRGKERNIGDEARMETGSGKEMEETIGRGKSKEKED